MGSETKLASIRVVAGLPFDIIDRKCAQYAAVLFFLRVITMEQRHADFLPYVTESNNPYASQGTLDNYIAYALRFN